MTLFEKNMDMEQPDLKFTRYPETMDFSDLRPEDIFEMGAVTDKVAEFKIENGTAFSRYKAGLQSGNWLVPMVIYVFSPANPSSPAIKAFCEIFDMHNTRIRDIYISSNDANIILPKWMEYKAKNLCMAKKRTPPPEPRYAPEPF